MTTQTDKELALARFNAKFKELVETSDNPGIVLIMPSLRASECGYVVTRLDNFGPLSTGLEMEFRAMYAFPWRDSIQLAMERGGGARSWKLEDLETREINGICDWWDRNGNGDGKFNLP